MENTPFFSIVITAYNKERYIGKAIHSVLGQTLQDFEILLIDDGSTDNTKEIISSFRDTRIKYFVQAHSGRPACARNKGMSFARGKYIAILDGDDFWRQDKLGRCKKILEDNPGVDLVCHNEAVLYNDKVVKYTSCGPYTGEMYKKILFDGINLPTSSVVIRRGIFSEDNFRFSEDPRHITIEDYEYWLRLSQKYRFCFIDDVLGYYRITGAGDYFRDPELNAINLLGLLELHFNKLKPFDKSTCKRMKKRRSLVMSIPARLYLHNSNFGKSREWYIKAIREYPFNYKAIIGFFAACLSVRIIYK